MSKFQKDVRNDFTVVHNGFIHDNRLGYAEKGLLLTLMSLPDDWNYSIAGLSALTPDGTYKVSAILKKLQKYGYFWREKITDERGRVADWVYHFSDEVHEEWIDSENDKEKPFLPDAENSHLGCPQVGDYPQSNINKLNKDYIDLDQAEQQVKENIKYDNLVNEYGADTVKPVIDVIVKTICSKKEVIRINKSKKLLLSNARKHLFLLQYENIKYVIENMQKNKCIPKCYESYILTSLFNLSEKAEKKKSDKPIECTRSPLSKVINMFVPNESNCCQKHSYNLDLLMQHAALTPLM